MKFPMILGGALTFEVHSCDWCMVIPVTCFFQMNLEFEKKHQGSPKSRPEKGESDSVIVLDQDFWFWVIPKKW